MRRQYELSEDDKAGLVARGLPFETVKEGEAKFLILPTYPIPAGYSVREAIALLRIPPSYPDEQIDMVYFSPALSLTSGRQIRQLTSCQFDGRAFQQWSRHRTNVNPWRPGLDSICTHLLQVDNWLQRELT
jgi:Prokaryotic E2 family E